MADGGRWLRAALRWASNVLSRAWSTRRWAVVTAGVAAVGVVAGLAWWATGSSPSPRSATASGHTGHHSGQPGGPHPGGGTGSTPAGGTKPLAVILAGDRGPTVRTPMLRDCATSESTAARLRLRTVVDSMACSGPPGSMISLWAYQFSNVLSYEKGFLRLNSVIGWDAAKAGHGCPSSVRAAAGRVEWEDPPRYPGQPGQVLDCAPAAKTVGPAFVWAMPTQRVLFLATDARAGATYGSLWDWLRSVHFD